MRAIEDIYEQWSTAAIHAAEATVTASSGLVRREQSLKMRGNTEL